jgi:hypothetical protein
MPLFLKYSNVSFNYKSESRKFTIDEKIPTPKITQMHDRHETKHGV